MKKIIAKNQCLFICLGAFITALGGAIAVSIVEHHLYLKDILRMTFTTWGFCCTAFFIAYDYKKKKSSV